MTKKNPPRDSADELHWRETYFIVFPRDRRPLLAEVQQALQATDERLRLENLAADAGGRVESLLVESPEDHAAVEISYEVGDAVVEQNLQWAKQIRQEATHEQLQLLLTCDARLDVAHFERIAAGSLPSPAEPPKSPAEPPTSADAWGDAHFGDEEFGEEDPLSAGGDPDFEMLDPTCVLTVVETLAGLTEGLAFDPAAGVIM
jgi:hypothetical protein